MVNFSKYEDKCWFKELRSNRNEFSDVNNIIESAKAKYERNNHTYEWITGSALGVIFSLSIADILKNQNAWIVIVGGVTYLVCLLAIVVGIWIYWFMNRRQEVALIWLYREKDKQHRKVRKK